MTLLSGVYRKIIRFVQSIRCSNHYRMTMTSQRGDPRIFYLTPDTQTPSWGIGMMYHHVRLLRERKLEAFVLHAKAPFKVNWIPHQVETVYANDKNFKIRSNDILVVPEIWAWDPKFTELKCQKIVFVQSSFNIVQIQSKNSNYSAVGYRRALTIMPHLKAIIEGYHGVEAFIAPCFVAPYFYLSNDQLKEPRKKIILLYPKQGGDKDYVILKKILEGEICKSNTKSGWELVELKGKTHEETAALMKEAAFFVNTNYYEAFNSSVPEAMAAGCICFCYDAFGPLDFLRNRINAYVFPNHHVYPLVDKLASVLQAYDQESLQLELRTLREKAFWTAVEFSQEKTQNALIDFYKPILN